MSSATQPTTSGVPNDLDSMLDPEWLTKELDNVGPGERITEIHRTDELATVASKVLFTASIDGPGGPRTHAYCLKSHVSEGRNAMVDEAAFYRDLRPHLDVRSPHAYYAGVDVENGRGLVIMDDLTARGYRFLNAHEPYSPERCRGSLGQLARLHAQTWGTEDDAEFLRPRMRRTASFLSAEVLQRLLDDGRADGAPPDLRDADAVLAAVEGVAALPATCVIHGDTHSGNAYLDTDGRVGWLDWQLVQRGHWAVDVSYHLATVLDIEGRRTHERELLRFYLDQLASRDVDVPEWDDAWDLYRLAGAWAYLLWSITQISSREVVMIHHPRIRAALEDHATFERVGLAR